MKSVDWRARTALITGASSGIGAATALRLAQGGMRMVLAARRLGRLETLADRIREQGGQAEAIAADLSCAEDRQRVFERHPEIDVLVNNAGICWYGFFADIPAEEVRKLLRLNVEATTEMTRLYLPGMLQRGLGRVINIGSIVGGFPMRGTTIYAASKAYMDAFNTALYRELGGSGVSACVVRPGPVATDFFEQTSARPYGQPLPGKSFAVPAETVAEAVWGLVQRPRRFAYVPGILRLVPWVENGFGWLFDWVGPVLLKRQQIKRA